MNELMTTEQLIKVSELQTITLKKVDTLEQWVLQAQNDIKNIKDNSYLHPAIINLITKKRRKRVVNCMGGKNSRAYQFTTKDDNGKNHRFSSEVFREMELDFKANFDLNSYAELPKAKKEEALIYIETWEPCTNTKMKIKTLNQDNLTLFG